MSGQRLDPAEGKVSRRSFLRLGARGVAGLLGAGAIGSLGRDLWSQSTLSATASEYDRGRFTLARIMYQGSWDAAFPNSDLNLMREFKIQAGERFETKIAQMTLSDEQIFRHPMLYITGMGLSSTISTRETVMLRRYLENGGFLFASDCAAGGTSFYYMIIDLLQNRTFRNDPKLRRLKLNQDHELFNVVVPFGDWSASLYQPNRYVAWEYDGRLVACLVSQFDHNCVLAARASDSRVTQQALLQSTNIIYYALTH